MARRLALEERLLYGMWVGAAVLRANSVSNRPDMKVKNVVCMKLSFGERYLSSGLFDKQLGEAYEIPRLANFGYILIHTD